MKTGKKVLIVVLALCSLAISTCFSVGAATQDPPEQSFHSETDVKAYFESIAPGGFNWDNYSSFIIVPQDGGNQFYFIPFGVTLVYNGRNLMIPTDAKAFLIRPNNTFDVTSVLVNLPEDLNSYYRSTDYNVAGFMAKANIKEFYALYSPPTEPSTEKVTAPPIESTIDQLATIINRLDIVTTIMLTGFGFIAAIVVVMLLYKFIRQTF